MTDPHPKRTTFVNPYGHIKPERDPNKQPTTGRVVADIDINDFRLLQYIRPSPRGVIQTTTNILLHKLIHELKRHGITDYTRCEDFEQFVTELRLVDGRQTASAADGEAARSNDGGGTSGAGEVLPAETQQPAVSASGDKPRSARGGKRGEGKSTARAKQKTKGD